MNGIELIAAERTRQIEEKGYTAEHDAEHNRESLAVAAVVYAMPKGMRRMRAWFDQWIPILWPWSPASWKLKERRVDELTVAGALIAAEIDRLIAGGS